MATDIPSKISHAAHLMFKLEGMRERRFICDFTVKVDNKSFAVHRVVLAACSDFFEAMFSNDMLETKQDFVRLKDMDVEAFTKCLEFMYTGYTATQLDLNVTANILKAADFLQFAEMTNYCIQFWENNLSAANCLKVKNISEAFGLATLAALADEYAVENFHEVSFTDGYRELDVTEVVEFMKKSSEDTIILWEAALSWMNDAQLTKGNNFIEILNKLKLEYCSFEFLFLTVWKNSIVSNSDICRKLVAFFLLETLGYDDIQTDNYFELLQLAKNHEDKDLYEKIKCWIYFYVGENFGSVHIELHFKSLDLIDIVEIFNNIDDCLLETAWKSAIVWVNHRKNKREKMLNEILVHLNLAVLSFTFLMTTAVKDPLVKKSQACMNLVVSALLKVLSSNDLNMENCLGFLKLSEKYDQICSPKTLSLIQEFISRNFETISLQEKFQQISIEQLYDILKWPMVKRYSENIQWNAVLTWIKRDTGTRKQHISNLLKCMRLETFSHDFIEKSIFAEDVVKHSEDCKSIIIEALFAKSRSNLTPYYSGCTSGINHYRPESVTVPRYMTSPDPYPCLQQPNKPLYYYSSPTTISRVKMVQATSIRQQPANSLRQPNTSLNYYASPTTVSQVRNVQSTGIRPQPADLLKQPNRFSNYNLSPTTVSQDRIGQATSIRQQPVDSLRQPNRFPNYYLSPTTVSQVENVQATKSQQQLEDDKL